jgi:branched-chain amino acid aminotransferase
MDLRDKIKTVSSNSDCFTLFLEGDMSSKIKVWINGEMVHWDQATVHIMSHSFTRGSAVFEVISFHQTPNGIAVFRLDEHLKRLRRTIELLSMELLHPAQEIEHGVMETIKANNLRNGFIKIIGYYGNPAFTLLPQQERLDLSIFAVDEDLSIDPKQHVSACFCRWRKLDPNTVPVEAKVAGNYINGMLARQEAISRGFDIGILLDTYGFVAEASTEAVFWVEGDVIKTPPLGRILDSISRLSILQAAKITGLKAVEEEVKPEKFVKADEIFFASTSCKISPVCRIDDRVLENIPGPVSSELARLMAEICAGKDERFKDWLFPVN